MMKIRNKTRLCYLERSDGVLSRETSLSLLHGSGGPGVRKRLENPSMDVLASNVDLDMVDHTCHDLVRGRGEREG